MIISVKDVSYTYPGGETPVLNHLDLEIEPGEFCAIVGGNGSGKTTLCKLLTGLIPHYHAGRCSGSVTVDGLGTANASVADIAHRIGYVAQDFENQLLRPRVLDDAAFAPLNFGYADHRERARKALSLLGLSAHENRVIWELSGGEKHLAALAGALALDPSIILVDEPVSQLDPVNAEIVYERLAELNRAGKTVIVVEHFAEFIGRYCSSVAFLEKGTLKAKLPVREALSRVEELEAAELAPPVSTLVAHRLGEKELPITASEAAALFAPRLGKQDPAYPAEQSSQTFKPRHAAGTTADDGSESAAASGNPGFGKVLLDIRALNHQYLGLDGRRRQVLRDVSFNIREGERVALVGSNGSGKSTLLKIMAGLIRPRDGKVFTNGMNARTASPEELAEAVSLVYQHPQEMFIEDEVEKDVRYFLDQRDRADADSRTKDLLDQFNLAGFARRDGRLLSGGQMRRASLAIGAGMDPRILLLDEPTSSLDTANRLQVSRMLSALDGPDFCAVVATHDMELAARWASRIIALREGKIVADCTTEEFFASPELCKTARVREPECVELSRLLGLNPRILCADKLTAYLKEAPLALAN